MILKGVIGSIVIILPRVFPDKLDLEINSIRQLDLRLFEIKFDKLILVLRLMLDL